MTSRPMDGMLVIDFTQMIAGPMCAMLCADLGAEVIKVEPPEGEGGRSFGSVDPNIKAFPIYETFNRGKRSIALNLRDENDLTVARSLCARADVVIEAFRPGVMDRLGLGAEELRAANPRLVYASISGFGPDGPGRTRPGLDSALQAETGLLEITGEPDGPPQRIGVHVVDVTTGHITLQAILAALLNRERHGVGDYVQTCLYDSGVSLQSHHYAEYLNYGVAPTRYGNHPTFSTPSGLYATADGHLVFSANTVRHWAAFCEATEMTDLVDDPRFATQNLRVLNGPELVEILSARIVTRPTAAWVELFNRHGVVFGEIHDYASAVASEQFAARKLTMTVSDDEHEFTTVRGPARYSSFEAAPTNAAPRVGQHNDEIRAQFGAAPSSV